MGERAGLIAGAVGATAAAVATVAGSHERASRRVARPCATAPAVTTAIIVLGYPSTRRGTTHPIQRWRARIGARTLAAAGDGVLIFSGGATRGRAESEAAVMARYALSVLGVPEHQVRIEAHARSTWENVAFSIPFADGAGRIAFASDPLHSARARAYLATQRQDLSHLLVGAEDYRLLEQWWLKILCLGYHGWVGAHHGLMSWRRGQAAADDAAPVARPAV